MKMVFLTKDTTKADKELDKILTVLRNDREFDDFVKDLMQHYDNLFDDIKIQQVEKINKQGEKFDIMQENPTDGAQHVPMYHRYRYIYTDLNINLTNLKHAVGNSTHRDNECWKNPPTDFYKDTLMDAQKR